MTPRLPSAILGCWRGRSTSRSLERRGADSIIEIEAPDAGATTYLYQTMQLPLYGWTIHRFTDLATVREDRRDGTIIGGAIVALIIALVLYVIERHRAYVMEKAAAAQLKAQVEERTRDLREFQHLAADRDRWASPHRSAAAHDPERAGAGR